MRLLILMLLSLAAWSAAAHSQACLSDATTACLGGDRFQIEVAYDTLGASFVPAAADSPSGSAEVVVEGAFPSDSAAPFSFYDSEQIDAVVRVLNGCAVNNRLWIFIAASTDSATTVSITDTATGDTVEYTNPAGQAFDPVLDTTAFETCDAGPRSGSVTKMETTQRGACGGTFCLQSDRYALDVAFDDTQGTSGMTSSALATDHSGIGSVIQQNVDFLSTVIDGRADNGAFWFLTSAISDFELTYTLTDTQTALTNTYVDPMGDSQNLLDRGQPVQAVLIGPPSAVPPGQSATYELTLTNSAPTERAFTATIPTPNGAINPSFTCTASNGASCPGASGSGPFSESGAIAAGGQLVYAYTIETISTRGAGDALLVEATVTTAAHALAGETNVVASARGSVFEPVAVPAFVPAALSILIVLMMTITFATVKRQGRGGWRA